MEKAVARANDVDLVVEGGDVSHPNENELAAARMHAT